jgi:hypothetical protein
MDKETKIYSNFIKRNADRLKVSKDYFYVDGEEIDISKDGAYWWIEGNGRFIGHSETKKAAIYWWCRNYTNLK